MRRHEPDFENFLKVLQRRGRPEYLPFYEHTYHPGFIARRLGVPFDKIPFGSDEFWRHYVDFWVGLGFDCIPMEVPPRITLPQKDRGGALTVESEAFVCIRSMEDFETFPWPDDTNPVNFAHFETVTRFLPPGIKIVGGVCGGPYEWTTYLLGVMGLSIASCEDPDLVEAVFSRLGRLYVSANRQLASMDGVGALRQGDDLGFKSATFLPPDALREHVFPIYTKMVAEAHGKGKPFILHSCGNLEAVYEDIIACGVDAKHSFEDTILPVGEFKRIYGNRITPLGGLDVDVICRSDEPALRRYTRERVEQCFADGYWALGSGNSLTDYMPVENYLIVLDEGRKAAGA